MRELSYVPDWDEQKLMIAIRDAKYGLDVWGLPENWEGRRRRHWVRLARHLVSREYITSGPRPVLTKDGVSAMVNSSVWRLSLENHPGHQGSTS